MEDTLKIAADLLKANADEIIVGFVVTVAGGLILSYWHGNEKVKGSKDKKNKVT